MSSNRNNNNINKNGAVTLDTEKHGARHRRPHVQRLDQSNGTASISAGTGSEEFTVSNDEDEFGGASDNEAPDSMFLTSLETEYEHEGEVAPSVLKPTKSQLQAYLPMGLDKEKHEDIGDLFLNNSSKSGAAAAVKSSVSRKLKEESVSSHNSCGEFGDADDHDLPAPQRLTESDHDVPPQLIPPTVQQPRRIGSSGLDTEKHEEIGDLLDSQHEEVLESTQHSRDEFGDAQENDAPVNQYLQNATDSMWMEDRGVVPRRVTASQLQAHIPSGLDSEKHEEIGDLLDSQHEEVFESTQHSRDEFGDAQENDAPVNQYLQNATESMWMEDRGVVPRRVTPSQLQAYIPSGLDSEKHEEIGDLMDSRHDVDDLDEFGDADEHDIPHKRFLHDSSHSMSYDDFDNSSHEDAQRTTIGSGISAPKYGGVTGNKRDKSGRTKDTDMSEREEQLDRWTDSYNDEDDDLESDIEYEDLKGSDTLDTEKHEVLGDFKEVASDDEDEFELAGENDDPVPRYLQSQHSLHGDDLSAYDGKRSVVHGLDDENHEDLSGFRSGFRSSSMSDDEGEFGCAGSYDNPSSSFLRHQVSMHNQEFMFSADDIPSDEGMTGSAH